MTLMAYFTLVIYLCLTPLDQAVASLLWDKAAHALAYAGFTAIAVFCTRKLKHFFYYLLSFTVFGILVEVAQGFTAFRSFSYLDMLANTSGVVLGLVSAWCLNKAVALPCFNTEKPRHKKTR